MGLGGIVLTELVDVIDVRGRTLTPCRRKVAEKEVRLNRAKWVGPNRIRLRFDPFAYRYIRLKVLVRDGYTCHWCGGFGDTMDHIIPWSKGGRTTMENCICACQECNGQRGDMAAGEFAKLRGVQPPAPAPAEQLPAKPTPSLGPIILATRARTASVVAAPRRFALVDLLDPYRSAVNQRGFY